MSEEREKLRDLYADAREGLLEPALRANFDARLDADPDLREDYDAYVAVCEGLDAFAAEPIAVPDFLSARIFDRLEADALATGPSAAGTGWWSRLLAPARRTPLRAFGLAALALVAVGGAALTVLHRRDASDVAPAGVLPGPARAPRRVAESSDAVRPLVEYGRVYVVLESAAPHDVSILAAPDAKNPDGTLLRRFRVDRTRLHTELANPYADPAAFIVRMDREAAPLTVVVPGSDRSRSAASGTGDLLAFGKALARTFGTPVVLRVAPRGPATAPGGPTVAWNFDDPAVGSAEAQPHALRALEGRGLSVDVMPGGLLSIGDR